MKPTMPWLQIIPGGAAPAPPNSENSWVLVKKAVVTAMLGDPAGREEGTGRGGHEEDEEEEEVSVAFPPIFYCL